MARRVLPYVVVACLAGLAGCSVFERPQRPAWRGQAEAACLAEKRVVASEFLRPASAIEGPGICGMDRPFKVTAFAGGSMPIAQGVTLACPAISEFDRWIAEVVIPTAQTRFGQPVVALTSTGGYSCRGMNNQAGARLSEHAFGNAVDVGGFRLADGRVVTVAKGWKSADPQEQAFLREVMAGACQIFTTVLGPGADAFHYDHLHMDLARHGSTSTGPRRICKPQPAPQLLPPPGPKRDDLPDPPPFDDELDIAAAPSTGRTSTLALGAPPPAPMRAATPPRSLAVGPLPPAPVGAPLALGRPAPVASAPVHRTPKTGALREDGAFAPEGDPADWDVTSALGRKRK